MATESSSAVAPKLQFTAGPDFGDGNFQPDDMVTIHNVSNIADGERAKIFAFDPEKSLYVVKDSNGGIWGLRAEKLKPQQVLDLDLAGETWQEVPDGVVVPAGADIKMDLTSQKKFARRIVADPASGGGVAETTTQSAQVSPSGQSSQTSSSSGSSVQVVK